MAFVAMCMLNECMSGHYCTDHAGCVAVVNVYQTSVTRCHITTPQALIMWSVAIIVHRPFLLKPQLISCQTENLF